MEKPKLTQYSHGSGCGCKIAPADLDAILAAAPAISRYPLLLVGTDTKDDAAVMEHGTDGCIISTTDFFMPVVDDATDFGRIAAANAISDIYAMGGTPLVAVAILGWPVEQLGTALAAEVIRGAQTACEEAKIPLAGGHSIDSKEPFFGLAVTGTAKKQHLKKNAGANAGDVFFLTKPLGVGIITTALKRGLALEQDTRKATEQMARLNSVGELLGTMPGVHAMTDVTGFGLLGHLLEMCEGSGVAANLVFENVPALPEEVLKPYLDKFIMPDNTMRNFKAYGSKVSKLTAHQLQILCDPQTNGGLLIAASPGNEDEIRQLLERQGLYSGTIGHFEDVRAGAPLIKVS